MAAHHKFIEWGTRYIPAEFFAILCSLAGGVGTHFLFNNPYATAFGATWAENFGYYSRIYYQDIQAKKKRKKHLTMVDRLKIFRDMVFEFGIGEYVDSFIVRPMAMYALPKMTGNIFWGLFLGKLVADVTFYIPTIISYELKKKYLRD